MTVEKVCPVVLRIKAQEKHVLVFRHPLAGIQLVKGTLELGESVAVAAQRELAEESGVRAEPRKAVASWFSDEIVTGQRWHFVLMDTPVLDERFEFRTEDDGGHVFRFFWWRLTSDPNEEWHGAFVNAFAEIRRKFC